MNRHVPPPELDRRDASSFTERSAPDFDRAQRHSARVRLIKRILPISIIGALALIVTVPMLARLQVKLDLPFDLGRLSLSGSRLTMELPKLSGFTEDNRGYSISAKTASQDLTNPDVVDLSEISARLELANKGWATVQATRGAFETKKQFITLNDGVELAMNGGYGGELKDAQVDVKAGTISTDKPVLFTYLDGKLVADRLTVTDRGTKALFEGNVQLDFRLSNLPGSQKGQGGAAPAPVQPAVAANGKPGAPARNGAGTTGSITAQPARATPPGTTATASAAPSPVPGASSFQLQQEFAPYTGALSLQSIDTTPTFGGVPLSLPTQRLPQ